ncbi:MAG: hypothetical protein ABSB66_17025, partial [Candidatus Acidiferrales bacterium]
LADYSGDAKKRALLTGGRQGRRASDCRQGAISCQVLFRLPELPTWKPSSCSLQTKLLAPACAVDKIRFIFRLTLIVCYRSEHIVALRHSVTLFDLHFHLLHLEFRKGFPFLFSTMNHPASL